MNIADRVNRSHSNADIDKTKSIQNYTVGCNDWNDAVRDWKNRVQKVDAEHPPARVRSDRITACMVEFPCPWDIVNQGHEQDFFYAMYNLMREQFGPENVHGICVHRDEVHDYIDKDGQTHTSMIHAHALVTPYARWTDKKGVEHEGINGKNFETRTMLHTFNKAVNDMCVETFGMEYNTHGLAQCKKTEELKRESAAAKLEREKERMIAFSDALTAEIVQKQNTLDEISREIIEATPMIVDALKAIDQCDTNDPFQGIAALQKIKEIFSKILEFPIIRDLYERLHPEIKAEKEISHDHSSDIR